MYDIRPRIMDWVMGEAHCFLCQKKIIICFLWAARNCTSTNGSLTTVGSNDRLGGSGRWKVLMTFSMEKDFTIEYVLDDVGDAKIHFLTDGNNADVILEK